MSDTTDMDDVFGDLSTEMVEEFGFDCTLTTTTVEYDSATGTEVPTTVEFTFKVIPPDKASNHEQDKLNLEVGDLLLYTSDLYFTVADVKPKVSRVIYFGQTYVVNAVEPIRTGARTPLIALVLRTQ